MRRYCGVIATYDGRVALVWERYDAWDAEYWNLPSGAVEEGETPAAGAVRELREESGLRVDEAELEMAWRTTAVHGGEVVSQSWNYVVSVTDPAFAIDDPDASVLDVRWFPVDDAVQLLAQVPYPPLAVPSSAYLKTGKRLAWTFTLAGEGWTWEPFPVVQENR